MGNILEDVTVLFANGKGLLPHHGHVHQHDRAGI